MTAVNIIGITVVFIMLTFAISKKDKQNSDLALIVTLFFFAGMLGADLWVKSDLNPVSFIFQSLISFYIFPTLFIYSLLLMQMGPRVKKLASVLFSLAIAFTLFIFLDFLVLADYGTDELYQLYISPPLIYHIFYKGQSLFAIAVAIYMLKQLKSYELKIRHNYSNIEAIQLPWLRNFMMIMIGSHSITIISFLLYNLGIITNIDIPFLLINSFIVLSLFYLSYNGIRQFVMANLPQPEVYLQPEEGSMKYASSSLSSEEMHKLFNDIKTLFEEEQVYHNPELKVQHVAEQLEVTSHRVSQTINQVAQMPFYDFVNSYRIEYFKILLTDPKNLKFTILALGLDSGFNSKSSLNRIFKQQVGLSPKEYRQQSA